MEEAEELEREQANMPAKLNGGKSQAVAVAESTITAQQAAHRTLLIQSL